MNPLHRRNRGVAIVLVLAFVVILAVLITAFFSQAILNRRIAASSAAQMAADELGRGAMAAVTSALQNEMAAGSEVLSVQGTTIFQPKADPGNPQNKLRRPWLPQRAGTASSLVNLVKTSSSGTPLYGGTDYDTSNYPVPLIPTAVSTETPAIDGRFVSRESWNKPLLLESTAFAADFVSPDWVLITRKGFGGTVPPIAKLKDPDPDNSDYAVGRYAFTIYDVGGLLDINVAGHPSTLDVAESARRGLLALADLSKIPGIDTATKADALINWRNAATAATATDYLTNILRPSNRFLKTQPGDRAFLSRQDLLDYSDKHPAVLNPAALSFLTTFSRDLEAPSHSPSTPAGSTWDYEAWAANPSSAPVGHANRNVATARHTQDTIIKTWEGENFSVKRGDPIVARRFPLSKLDLFRQYYEAKANGNDTAKLLDEIRWSFGLEPDTARISAGDDVVGWWEYTAPKISGRLLTPEQSAMTTSGYPPHEPNFFELLWMGILRGETGFGNSEAQDLQHSGKMILRIGANLIDQYDEDSYPTILRLDPTSSPVAGIENLPYVSECLWHPYRPDDGAAREMLHGWHEFELWNPHGNAETMPVEGTRQMRIVATGGEAYFELYTGWWGNNPSGSTAVPSEKIDYGAEFNSSNPDSTKYRITFDYPAGGSEYFRDPTLLSDIAHTNHDPDGQEGTGFERISGFLAGRLNAPVNPPNFQYVNGWFRVSSGADPAIFELQLWDERNDEWLAIQSCGFTGNDTTEFGPFAGRDKPYPGNVSPYVNYAGIPQRQGSYLGLGFRPVGFPRTDPRDFHNMMHQHDHTWMATPRLSMMPHSTSDLFARFYQYAQTPGGEMDAAGNGGNWPLSRLGRHSVITSGNNVYPQYLAENFLSATSPWALKGRDDVIRRADGGRDRGIYLHLPSKTNPYVSALISSGKLDSSLVNTDRLKERPIVLNRAFRSVGDIGYAYRAYPWKTIDLVNPTSPDAALLDLFTLKEVPREAPVSAAKVNLNSARPEVLRALLNGALQSEENSAEVITQAETDQIASDFQTFILNSGNDTSKGPLLHRSELVTRYGQFMEANLQNFDQGRYPAIKRQREAVIRSLGEAGMTRTWNLLVDFVVQAGIFPASANSLDKFSPKAQRRFWMHLAIDRVTGAVVDRQIEPVYE